MHLTFRLVAVNHALAGKKKDKTHNEKTTRRDIQVHENKNQCVTYKATNTSDNEMKHALGEAVGQETHCTGLCLGQARVRSADFCYS